MQVIRPEPLSVSSTTILELLDSAESWEQPHYTGAVAAWLATSPADGFPIEYLLLLAKELHRRWPHMTFLQSKHRPTAHLLNHWLSHGAAYAAIWPWIASLKNLNGARVNGRTMAEVLAEKIKYAGRNHGLVDFAAWTYLTTHKAEGAWLHRTIFENASMALKLMESLQPSLVKPRDADWSMETIQHVFKVDRLLTIAARNHLEFRTNGGNQYSMIDALGQLLQHPIVENKEADGSTFMSVPLLEGELTPQGEGRTAGWVMRLPESNRAAKAIAAHLPFGYSLKSHNGNSRLFKLTQDL